MSCNRTSKALEQLEPRGRWRPLRESGGTSARLFVNWQPETGTQNKHHGEQLLEVYFKNFEGERPAKAALVLSATREAVSRRKWFQVPLCFRKSPPTSAYLRIEPYTRDWWLFDTVRTKLFTTLAVNVRKSCFSEETLKHAVGTEVHELRWIKFTTNSYLSNLMYTWTVSPSER